MNFRNNRILSDADNEFDLNEFCQSTLSLADQFNDCNDSNKEIAYLRNIIDSHIKKHKGSNTSLDLKNVDSKTKKIINGLRKELEELKKQIADKTNGELAIQPIDDKMIVKKDGNSSVSEHEDFKKFEINENNKITSNNHHIKLVFNKKIRKEVIKATLSYFTFLTIAISIPITGLFSLTILLIPSGLSIFFFICRLIKCIFKLEKISK
ncbi:fam-b protein [Plasmodium berghei]|uniref:Fam-b protein n=1 Tax=Plasmodium berghei TaxID=5821 RepID=A0A113RJS3_PLABE|nr:fam-b protein [Plasmodium berghei]